MNERAFTEYSVPRALLKFTIPAALSQLTFLLLNLADAFFIGRTGDTYQIATMTVTFPVVMLISCVGTIFGAGANANMATELGKGNRDKARDFSVYSIYASILAVIIISLVLLAFETPILYQIGASDNSIGYCKDYLLWTMHVGCIPLVLTQVISQLFLAEGESKLSALGIAGAGALNVCLDPVFVFGLGMGVAGAGLATCIANYVSFFFYLLVWMKKRKTSVVCFYKKGFRFQGASFGRLLSVGIPAGLVILLMDICDFTRNWLFGSLGGPVEIAAWGVVQKIGNASMQICVGIAQGVRPVVAFNYAAGLFRRVKSLVVGGAIIMLGWCVACLLLIHIAPQAVVSILVPTGEAVPVAVSYLTVWANCILGFGMVELFNAVFQATGSWKISLGNTLINKGILLSPVMVIVARYIGIQGILISQPVTESLTAVTLLLIYIFKIHLGLKNESPIGNNQP